MANTESLFKNLEVLTMRERGDYREWSLDSDEATVIKTVKGEYFYDSLFHVSEALLGDVRRTVPYEFFRSEDCSKQKFEIFTM